eukprot:COSAG02_NODE_8863_length_2417_cov_34.257981_1_plen_101_part_10
MRITLVPSTVAVILGAIVGYANAEYRVARREDIAGWRLDKAESTHSLDSSATSGQLISTSDFTYGAAANACREDIAGRRLDKAESTRSLDSSATSGQLIST